MKKHTIYISLVFVLLFVTAAAQAASAPQVFMFADGYTANYAASQGTGKAWNAEIQFIGTTSQGGNLWMTMQMGNWAGDGANISMEVRTTANVLYEYDSTQPGITPPYSFPFFKRMDVNQSWTYQDAKGNAVTATVTSIGSVTVPAGTYKNVYAVHYVSTVQDEVMYWEPGVGLIQDVDSSPGLGTPITRQLTSHPVAEILVGTWAGKMQIVTSNTTAVEKGTVQVTFAQVGDTKQAYTGSLTWVPDKNSEGTSFTLPLTVIRGPFDPTLLHISALGDVILGEMRKHVATWVVDLHGTDTAAGNTFVALGLSKE